MSTVERLLQRATQRLHQGDRVGAREDAEAALASEASSGEAWRLLGTLDLLEGALEDAARRLERAAALRPGDARLRVNLGVALRGLGRLGASEARLREATRLAPGLGGAWSNLSITLLSSGSSEEAVACAREATVREPALSDGWSNLGLCLEQGGQLEAAAAAYAEALLRDPRQEVAFAGLARVGGVRPAQLDPLLALAEAETLPPDGQRSLRFALARALHGLGRFPEAFAQARRGNRLREARWGRFDRQAHRERRRALLALARRLHPLDNDDAPVLIVGFPRSGTTLIERVLAGCPGVVAGGESPTLWRLGEESLARWGEGGRPARRWMEAAAQALREEGVTTRKLPGALEALGLAAALFPSARVVLARRRAFDACMSCYFRDFVRPHRWKHRQEDLAWAWAEDEALARRWREELGLRVVVQDLGALVADPEGQGRALAEACGLSWAGLRLGLSPAQGLTLDPRARAATRPTPAAMTRWEPYRGEASALAEALGSTA